MARGLGDIGMFLPSETQYGPPGSYETLLRGEAQKRAAYLADIEAFYAELEETQRQFNETLGFKTETRDLELAFAEKELAQRADLSSRELDLQSSQFNRELAFREESRESAEALERYKINASLPPRHLGGVSEREQFEFLKHQLGKSQKPTRSASALIWSGPEHTPRTSWPAPDTSFRPSSDLLDRQIALEKKWLDIERSR